MGVAIRPLVFNRQSQFTLAGVTSQQRKYHYIASALSQSASDEVYDVMTNPSVTAPFDHLKCASLQRAAASEGPALKQFLASEDLGDRCSNQVFHKMTQRLGEQDTISARTIHNVLICEIFLQRLQANV